MINAEVIAKYSFVAVECFGIVGMAAVSVKDGMARLLKERNFDTWDPVANSEENRITLNFHVIVSYGVNILSVSDNLKHNVKS